MAATFEQQLQSAINAYHEALSACRFSNGADMDAATRQQLYTSCLATIERVVGANSIYFREAQTRKHIGYEFLELAVAVGICRSLLADLQNGSLRSLAETVRSDLFANYLEISERLNSQGRHGAAAIVAGSTLEAHLKALCEKNGLETDIEPSSGKCNSLNDELARAAAYSKIDHENVKAWLEIRDNAIHRSDATVDHSQVAILILGIREFVARHPA